MNRPVLLFLFFFFLFQGPSSADNIQLGAILPLTGKMVGEGVPARNGYELWKETTNKKGGIKIGDKYYLVDIKYYDYESDVDKGTRLLERLITEDRIKLVLGSVSSKAAFALSDTVEKYGALMIQGGGADRLYTRGHKDLFGLNSVATEYMEDILKMLKNKSPGPETVAIIYSSDPFSTQVAEGAKAAAEKNGYKVVFYRGYPRQTYDISAVITQMKEKDPDIILGCSLFGDTANVVRHCKALGVNPKALAFSIGPTLPDFVNSLKSDAENILAPAQWTAALKYKDPVFGDNQGFIKLYEAKHNAAPIEYSAGAAAAAVIFQKALEKAGTKDDLNKIREALLNIDEETIYGRIRFDRTGKVTGKGMAVIQIQNGLPKTVYPESMADAALIYPKPQWKGSSMNYYLGKYGAGFSGPDFKDAESAGDNLIHAEKGKEKVRLKVAVGLERGESNKYVDEMTALLEGLFDPYLPPYPEFLTNQTSCDKSFKPVRTNSDYGPYFLLYAGDRLGYGICAKDLIKYKAGLAFFYCQDTRNLFKIEYFVPNDESFEKIERLLGNFQCIKPGGR